MSPAFVLLSLIIFLPALGALALMLMPRQSSDVVRLFSLAVTGVTFALSIWLILPGARVSFELGAAEMQQVVNVPWIPSFNIHYLLGVDGVSLPFVVLTTFLCVLAMWASWPIEKHVKPYCVLFLLLETGILGVFFALDFFLFYVFWEFMLLPMYFLIGVWGGPRKEYAAIKFFLYTFFGGVAMLVAILALYFNSDLNKLHDANLGESFSWDELHLPADTIDRVQARAVVHLHEEGDDDHSADLVIRARRPGIEYLGSTVLFQLDNKLGVGSETVEWDGESRVLTVGVADGTRAGDVVAAIRQNKDVSLLFSANGPELRSGTIPAGTKFNMLPLGVPEGLQDPEKILDKLRKLEPVHTFNLLALAALGQHTDCFNNPEDKFWGMTIETWAFLLLFLGFAIKVPVVPFHTWLPDAHVEAPTPISMLLAGILLKLGGYGIIRICYPICPGAAYELAWLVCGIGVVSMVYGAFAALAQKDFKRLVAYSSVSHMGYVILGIGVWSAVAGQQYDAESWKLGMNGAMFQMIAHGLSSAGMFFMVGVVYERVHHRNLDEFGGLFAKMPVYSGMAIGIFFAGLGLPGLCGFIGEVFVTLSAWNYSKVMAIIAASTVILTAGYILWTLQRVYLGAEYKGPHGDHLTDLTSREKWIAAPLLAFAILFGVFPRAVLDYVAPSVNQGIDDLVDWRIRQDETNPAEEDELAAAPAAKPANSPRIAALDVAEEADEELPTNDTNHTNKNRELRQLE